MWLERIRKLDFCCLGPLQSDSYAVVLLNKDAMPHDIKVCLYPALSYCYIVDIFHVHEISWFGLILDWTRMTRMRSGICGNTKIWEFSRQDVHTVRHFDYDIHK